MRINTRRHYTSSVDHNELMACIFMGATVAVLVVAIAGFIIMSINSDDAFTRCTVLHSHDTCAYALR